MTTRRVVLKTATAMATLAGAAWSHAAQLPRRMLAAARPAAGANGGLPAERIVYKGSARYEAFRQSAVWNARKPERYPEAIVMAESVDDVIAAVKLAKA